MNCLKLAEAVELWEPFNERPSTYPTCYALSMQRGRPGRTWRRAPTAHYLPKLARRGLRQVQGGKIVCYP